MPYSTVCSFRHIFGKTYHTQAFTHYSYVCTGYFAVVHTFTISIPMLTSSSILEIIPFIDSLAFFEFSARTLTSSATTAKPLPCSPALAASMLAFNASRFVCYVISPMVCANSATSFMAALRLTIELSVSAAVPRIFSMLAAVSFIYVMYSPSFS